MDQKDLEELVVQAKKDLTIEQLKDAVRISACGGRAIGMDLKRPLDCMGITMEGGNCLGKTNT